MRPSYRRDAEPPGRDAEPAPNGLPDLRRTASRGSNPKPGPTRNRPRTAEAARGRGRDAGRVAPSVAGSTGYWTVSVPVMSGCTSHRKKYVPAARAGTWYTRSPWAKTSPWKTRLEAELSVKIDTLWGALSWFWNVIANALPAGALTSCVWNLIPCAPTTGELESTAAVGAGVPDVSALAGAHAAAPSATVASARVAMRRFTAG